MRLPQLPPTSYRHHPDDWGRNPARPTRLRLEQRIDQVVPVLSKHPLETHAPDGPAGHGGAHIPLEAFPVGAEVICGVFIQGIGGIRLEEEELRKLEERLAPITFRPRGDGVKDTHLHAHNNRIQVQHGLPVLAQDVQAHIAIQVDVGVIDLLGTLDLGRVMREVLVDGETKVENAALVHALVRLYGQSKVQDVVGVREGHLHSISEGEFLEVCRWRWECQKEVRVIIRLVPDTRVQRIDRKAMGRDTPRCTRSCAAVTFFFFLPAAPSAFSACACCCFCGRDQYMIFFCIGYLDYPRCSPTIDQIFNILAGSHHPTWWNDGEHEIVRGSPGGGRSLPTSDESNDQDRHSTNATSRR